LLGDLIVTIRFPAFVGLLFLSAFAAEHAAAAAPTTFVASSGADSNGTYNCARATPCRTFAGALAVTSVGGEVIVLDSADFGPAQILQSVSIIAPAGVYAGIRVTNGLGITVGNGSGSVSLSGLTFEGPGSPNITKTGASGVVVGNFTGSVVIQSCNFSGFFPNGAGYGGGVAIQVSGSTNTLVHAHVIDTAIHDSFAGIDLTGHVTASISHVRLTNLSGYGVNVADQGSGETDVSVSDSEWSAPSLAGGNAFQLDALSESTQLYIDHTVMTGGAKGVYAVSSGALAYVTVTNSTLSKIWGALSTAGGAAEITFSSSTLNANSNAASNVAGGTLISAGNNLFIGNGSDVVGSVTAITLH
jgi:hypothetical protein